MPAHSLNIPSQIAKARPPQCHAVLRCVLCVVQMINFLELSLFNIMVEDEWLDLGTGGGEQGVVAQEELEALDHALQVQAQHIEGFTNDKCAEGGRCSRGGRCL